MNVRGKKTGHDIVKCVVSGFLVRLGSEPLLLWGNLWKEAIWRFRS